MEFTNEQLQAIESQGSQLLVSAAAGSGKTAVLVERIIRRILDENAPVDIDRMLVMTFTRAAASQMKDKIIKAIDKKKAEKPGDLNLIRQSALVHNARITTIHGFCLDVIRDHFQEIGLDPSFRVADEGECRLLKQGVLEAVIEEAYEESSGDFISMAECLAAGKSDKALEDILDKLYDFSMSDPDPDNWLDRCADAYENVSVDTMDDQAWMKVVIDNAELVIKEAVAKASKALSLAVDTGGPYMYAEAIERDLETFDRLLACSDYDGYRNALLGLAWTKLGRASKSGPDIDEDIKELVKEIRNDYKASVNKLILGEFALSKEEHARRIKACAPVVSELVKLTRKMIVSYAALKRDKNVVDFSDLEHMCIKILAAEDGNTAREYREFFEEIYVDEYQDSSLIQEELLKYIARDDNLFMVGDVKQSIYSFRLARPQLFMDKYTEFGTVEKSVCSSDKGRRIDLSYNFRSRSTVLDSVNEVFSQVMSARLGGIDYDEAASLKAGASYPDNGDENRTELIAIPSEKGIDSRELEARVIAERIRGLMKGFKISDPTEEEPDRMRMIRYSDIVILLRSAKGWDEKFKNILSNEGIPVYVMSQTGYFGAYEVSVLLDYLTVLDNPLQDIPMAAVLRSAFGCFDDDELALIRVSYPEKYLFNSVEDCARKDDTHFNDIREETRKKAAAFIDTFKSYRDRLGYTSVYELLVDMIDGDYGIYVSSLPGGRRKKANLNMLLKKAEDYGRTSYKGLFHFVKYIEMLKKYEIDFGEANVLDENDDTVRIMTIHKSKGLEFPVCFVAGMSKGYNFLDSQASIIPDIDMGLGVPLVDPVKRIKQMTLLRRAAARKKYYETLAEEERVLYVAMTRAKEKLILTGIVKEWKEALKRDRGLIRCNCYLDLVIHALNKAGLPSVEVSQIGVQDLIESGIRETAGLEAGRMMLEGIFKTDIPDLITDDALADVLKRRFSFVYPYENEKNSFEKVSVSELKRRSMQEGSEDKELPEQIRELYHEGPPPVTKEDSSRYIPDFILGEDKEMSAALHGTAVHRIFELWDYDRGTADDDIAAFLKDVRDKGLMADELIDSIGIREISGFINSELAQRMERAYKRGQLYREQPFIFSHEGLLVQGIIDAYFIEDGEIVIVDYKTDNVRNINELVEKYHVQLEYYAKALSSLLNLPVKELIIYSTRFKKTVIVPWVVVH